MQFFYDFFEITVTLFSYVFIYVVERVEGRVFCQDSNARPWVPLGPNCPVVCASVMNAIDKLILLDYKKSIKEQLGGRQTLNKKLITYDRNNYIRTKYYSTGRKLSADDKNDINIANSDENFKQSKLKIDGDNIIIKTNYENYGNDNNYGSTKDGLANNNENSKNSEKSFNGSKHDVYKINGIIETEDLKIVHNIEHVTEEGFDENSKIFTENKDKLEINNKQTENKKGVLYDLKILESIKNVKGILRRAGNIIGNTTENNLDKDIKSEKKYYDLNKRKLIEDKRCWFLEKFKPNLLIGKVVRKRCSRRSNFDAKFVSVMKDVLNKYVDSEFRFTDEMTEILLENIFGKNTDLRNNIFDVNKLLVYLRKSVDRHRIHSHKHVITLKSRHCLSGAMPGCFCRPGFVESSGQCVKPEDCIENKYYLHYLKRIIVL